MSDWRRVEEIVHAALERSPGERLAFVRNACGSDDSLRVEVESLLRNASAADKSALKIGNLGLDLIGQQIGVYRVDALLGAGGMGEVYRARDTKLQRDVAIKALPVVFTGDSDRRARFEREARVLASLNHPHIGAIYGLEESQGTSYLVLELVEGITLADRIAKGPLSLSDSLEIARQIADALEAAHEKGIVHRDLKPANIKLTADGKVKVLDFGLAKLSQSSDQINTAATETIATREGAVFGTPGYMSPEQVRGLTVDKRTDIWAFGCVLFEMLTGQVAFRGQTVSDTIAAVLDREPNWSALQASTPPNVRRLLERCLVKNSKGRLRDIADARFELDDTAIAERSSPGQASDVPPGTERSWRFLALMAAAILAATVGALALTARSVLLGSGTLNTTSHRFAPLVAEPANENSPSWSPDGKSVVYVAEIDGVRQVFTRSLGSAISTQITKFATDVLAPSWSSDGTRIYFTSQPMLGGGLYSVGATGGEPQLIMKDAGAATVAPDGKTLAFLRGVGGRRSLWTAAIPGGEPRPYQTSPFPQMFTRSNSVEFSPDGGQIAVLVERQDGPSLSSELWVIPYPSGRPRRVLTRARDNSGGRISWLSDNRHIVMDGVFLDRPGIHLYLADTESGRIVPITSGTAEEGDPSVSPKGDTIAFVAGGSDFDLVRIPVDGSDVQTLLASPRSEKTPTWSPTGSQLVYVTNARGMDEIWARSIEEGWTRPIIPRQPGADSWTNLNRASFSPDGVRIVYEVLGPRHAIWVSSVADGRGVPLDPESPDQHSPAWSPDGKWIAYQRLHDENWELVKVPSGGGRPVRLAEATPGGGDHTAWSPTGEWIAHVADETLRLTHAGDGKIQKALSGAPPAAFGFSLDGSSLYAVRRAPEGTWQLVTFDIQSGGERKVISLNLPQRAIVTGFSLEPNGNSFATAIGIPRHDIWLLEGFKQPSAWGHWF